MEEDGATASTVKNSYFTKDKSYLEQLPLELREIIYANLLLSNHVKCSSSDSSTVRYKFQPAILGVNRTIRLETKQMLYEKNALVLVSINFKNIFKLLERERLPLISNCHLEDFHEYYLQVYMSFSNKWHSEIDDKFLMVVQDLPQFVRIMLIQYHMCSSLYQFRLHLTLHHPRSGSLALSMQKLLLGPFIPFHDGICESRIFGAVDLNYRFEALSQMTLLAEPQDRSGSLYQLAQGLKKDADHAAQHGDMKYALGRYFQIHMLHYRTLRWEASSGNLSQWRIAFAQLRYRVCINEALLCLREKDYSGVILTIKNAHIDHSIIPHHYLAKLKHYIGLSHAAKSMMATNHRARHFFEAALRLDPDNAGIRASLELLRKNFTQTGEEDGSPEKVAATDTLMKEVDVSN
ncbi:hypothetical protein MMC14_010164 [Varicellaria rhodocarpa]|nr:hypothetical protein [Varicellaria rhodocarpa]